MKKERDGVMILTYCAHPLSRVTASWAGAKQTGAVLSLAPSFLI